MAVVLKQLSFMAEAAKAPIKEDESLILIVCYLQRIIVPLRAYVDAVMALPVCQDLIKQVGHANPVKVCRWTPSGPQ